ncbi:MAG: hypothetical protein HZB46_03735, partial [Solirubrobacterales bacterium]|nr:hypothetical protein [Solirubrobacterales bacterium]
PEVLLCGHGLPVTGPETPAAVEEAHGDDGFWTRLAGLRAPALFVWGRKDQLVSLAFARHVRDVLPAAQHLELDCGHVPQLERPRATHEAMVRFLAR